MVKDKKVKDSKSNTVKPKCGKDPIVIEEKEEDILITELKGDPDNFKQEVRKEAQKGKAMRILLPIIFFLILGTIVGGATWYYQNSNKEAAPKNADEKIQTPPIVDEDEEVIENEDPVAETPEPTPTPTLTTPPATSTTGYTEYTVKAGDTLSGIANANDMTSAELASYNNITNPESLQIGQVLKIPKN
jgi:LysM repeat protein